MHLSSALDEAIQPTTDFIRQDAGVFVVPPAVTEGSGDEWMQEAIRQFQFVAPAHAAWLKRQTGRGWKLFKHFLHENGRLLFRFDLARRQDIVNDPMIVVRMAYSAGADLYSVQIEVWESVGSKIDSHETTDVDVDMLQDPERFYYRVKGGLAQLKPGGARTEGNDMADLSSDLLSALTETGSEGAHFDPEKYAAKSKASREAGDAKKKREAEHGAAVKKTLGTDKPKGGGIGGAIKRGMKMVFGKWVKVEGVEAEGPDVFEPDEALIGTSLDEARSNLSVDTGGGFTMEPRTNPTKTGPAAERSATLKTARMGIERMMAALDTVRQWIAPLSLGDKDKSGAARAALKMAAEEIGKVESVQGVIASIFEMDGVDGACFEAMDAAVRFIVEKRGEPTPEAAKAMEGLTRMVDGLRQLQGMLRQAKLTGRILGAVDAAIAGLKATRDAIGALSEDGPIEPPSSAAWERTKAAQVRRGSWVKGGTPSDPVFRQVAKVERMNEDMAYVVLHFDRDYVGADGQRHSSARFHKDAVVSAAKG